MPNKLFRKLLLVFLPLAVVLLYGVDFYTMRALRQGTLETLALSYAPGRLQELRPLHPDDPQELKDWVRWACFGEARVTVFRLDSTVIADAAADPRAFDGDGDLDVVRRAINGAGASSIRRSTRGDRELAYWAVRYGAPAGGTPVVVRVALPLAEPPSAVRKLRLQVAGLVLAVLLACGAAIYVIFSSVERRIQRLGGFLDQAAAGMIHTKMPESGWGELSSLAQKARSATDQLGRRIQELTAQSDFSVAVLRSMSEGVVVVNGEGRIVFANEGFAAAIGVELSQCRGRPLLEVTRQQELVVAVERAMSQGEMVSGEVEFGTVRPRSFELAAARVEAPTTSGAVLVLHDVSEIRRLERVRRDFVANVSHELRTPLTAIQGFAETLLGGALDDPKASRRFLEIVRDHATRLGRITDDLLKLSAIEAGKLTFEMRPLNIAGLMDTCLETAALKAKAKRIVLAADCPRDLPPARGDIMRLQELLQNLLDNALQYTPEGGSVKVRARQENENVVVCVQDTGMGIPIAEQERIFERFYRLDAARSRAVGGTGLGLSIARHIAEAHGGRIWVESEVGQGSRFYVTIPVWKGEGDAEPSAP